MTEKAYDMGVVEALGLYLGKGLHPGSFGYAILTQNTELAYRCAHPRLKPNRQYGHSNQDVVANMLDLVRDTIPSFASGDKETVDAWMESGGFSMGDRENELMQLKLTDGAWAAWYPFLDIKNAS